MKATMLDVLGIGENSVDLVYRLPAWPAPHGAGSKLPITTSAVRCGGQVATTMATCAAFGLKAGYVGTFGNDEHGVRVRRALSARGVDLRAAVRRQAPNRHAVILIDDKRGDRAVLWRRDPRLALRPSDLRKLRLRTRWLHVDAVDEDASLYAAERAAAARVPVSCDIDAVTEGTRELIRLVNVPILAEHLPRELAGARTLERALRAIARPHHTAVCVTQGVRGATMLMGGRIYRAPAFTVEAVDTTGAGDVFRGAFIYAMQRRFEPAEVLRFANAAAAISCTRQGALDSVPTLREVRRFLTTKVPEHTST